MFKVLASAHEPQNFFPLALNLPSNPLPAPPVGVGPGTDVGEEGGFDVGAGGAAPGRHLCAE